jgi:hypothetical protein
MTWPSRIRPSLQEIRESGDRRKTIRCFSIYEFIAVNKHSRSTLNDKIATSSLTCMKTEKIDTLSARVITARNNNNLCDSPSFFAFPGLPSWLPALGFASCLAYCHLGSRTSDWGGESHKILYVTRERVGNPSDVMYYCMSRQLFRWNGV